MLRREAKSGDIDRRKVRDPQRIVADDLQGASHDGVVACGPGGLLLALTAARSIADGDREPPAAWRSAARSTKRVLMPLLSTR
jgi:hypothetical protein